MEGDAIAREGHIRNTKRERNREETKAAQRKEQNWRLKEYDGKETENNTLTKAMYKQYEKGREYLNYGI